MEFVAAAIVLVLFFLVFKPFSKRTSSAEKSTKKVYTIDDEFNAKRKEKQLEIDRILDKIHTKGVESLSKQEKALLDEFSNSK